MSFLTKLLGGGDVVKSVGDTLDNLFTSDEERMEAEQEILKARRNFDYLEAKLLAEQNIAQVGVNIQEAKGNWFQSGWRPSIGWIGVLCLAYQFVIYPLLAWLPVENPPEPMDYTMVYTIITAMLGIAGMRSFDKLKKTDTRR